ncbi:MAG TPA: PAS domain S-box protein [Leptolyngbyaceae cyanobacterium]
MQFLPRHLWLRYLESIIDNSPLTVEPETPLSDAISQMASQGADIVVVANSQVLGYLSAADVVKLVALGVDLQNTQIAEVINPAQSVFQLSQFEDVATIISMLGKNQSNCLLLVDEQAQLLGIITCGSIYQALEAVTELNNQEQLQISQAPLKLLKSAVVSTDDAISTREKSLGNIPDTRPVLTWVSGTDTLCNFFNKNWLEFTGSSLEQEIGKSWTERVHPEDLQNFLNIYLSAFHAREYFSVEYRLRRVDGKYSWFLNVGVPKFTSGGSFDGYINSCIDINEYKQAANQELERQLAERTLALEEANKQLLAHKTEECFQFLAEFIPQQVWIARPDGYIEYVNQRTLEYYGCEPEALLGWQWQQLIHPDDSSPYMEAWLHSLATGQPFEVEFRSLRADHTYRWHLGRAEARRDQQGNIINWFGTNTDIDDVYDELRLRQRTELALRHSEAKFRNLVEASSDCLWEVDENAVYTYVNPKVKDILGYEPEELLGKTPFEMMTPKEAERVMNIYAPIAAAQQPYNCLENTIVHKQGHLVVLETSGVPVFDAVGKFCGYRGINRDITVKKQVENHLYQTQQQLQTILNNCPAVIYVTDLQNRFILINQRYEHLFNTTQAEIIGKSLYETWPDDFARGFALNNQQVLNTGIPLEVEEIVPQEDGLHTYFSIKFPLKDQNGIIYGICGISTDITERKLAENSLLRFHKAMESTSDAIIFSDILDKSIYINPAFEELYGYSLEELQAHGGVRRVFQQPLERQTILDTVMKGNSWRGEVAMRSRDGRQLKVDMRSDALKDSRGKITGIVCIHTDVTQHQQIEEGLRLRDRAIDASSNGIIIADATTPNGPIIYVNPAFERMTGYSSAEVIGQNFRIFQSADIDQPGLRELSAAMQAGKACTVVLRNYRKDGSLLWNEFNISPVYDHTGQLTHYISIQTDITERKQAETALLVSQQRLQYLLTSSPAVIYTSRTFGEFGTLFISDNVTAMTGYEAREFTEDPSFWVSHIHPEDVASVFHKLSHVLERKNYKLEYRFLHKDGTYHWIYDQGRVVQDDINNPIERVGYLINITERKQLEDYLKVALEKEKELSELKSRFVSMTSHEFRTPLSTILSSSELLEHYRHKWTEEKQLTHLHRIQTAVKRMTEMLNDILIIGKAEAGRLEFVPKSFDVVAYCRTLVEEVQLNRTNHQVYFLSEHEYMSCYMDDKLLGHILSNLISNAIKYSPVSSRVLVKFYCQDDCAVFEVHDWGIGIPPEDITHLFESFYRAKNVGNILGTGLGLAIVKKCVDICQGEIFVSSKLGVGTVFTVNLPLNYQI